MNKTTTTGNRATHNKKNTISLGYWTLAWLVTMAIATFGSKFIWQPDQRLTILAIVINLIIGFGMILANKRHLQSLDEMQQKILLEAMASTLGVGLISSLSYSLLDTTNLISFNAEISHIVILMGITYIIAVAIGHRRYQ